MTQLKNVQMIWLKVEKLEKNESFYLQLKKQLEGENAEMVEETNSLRQDKDALAKEVAESSEKVDDLEDEIRTLERELSNAKDDLVRAQRARPVEVEKEDDGPNVSQSFITNVLNWAHKYSTMAFPAEISVITQPVTLTDRSKQVQVPVYPGGSLGRPFSSICKRIPRRRPNKQRQALSHVKIDNTSLVESLASKYTKHMNSMGNSVANPYEKKK